MAEVSRPMLTGGNVLLLFFVLRPILPILCVYEKPECTGKILTPLGSSLHKIIYLLTGNKCGNKHFIVMIVLLEHCSLRKKITQIET